MQAAPYSQEPQSPMVLRRLRGRAKLPVITTLFLQEGEGTHFSNKQRREKINTDVCNEFLFPEIAQQEPCQEELGLISCKMRDTIQGHYSVLQPPWVAGCQPQDLQGCRPVGELSWWGGGREQWWSCLLRKNCRFSGWLGNGGNPGQAAQWMFS